MPDPWGDGEWHLYNVTTDPDEKKDLASNESGILAELVAYWDDYARENGVILPDWVSGY
jgi:arylsulfatase